MDLSRSWPPPCCVQWIGFGVMATKILIVDDDSETRDLLCEVLEASGYVPRAVPSAQPAREVLRQDSEYRIVIADFQMPHESGLELLRKLRHDGSTHEVILMSSFMSAMEKKEAKSLGAYAL